MTAEELIKAGDVQAALAELRGRIRAKPSDASLRVFLFQLLAVSGQWEKALDQLQISGELDSKTLLMVEMYRPAVLCEAIRADVFAGRRVPVLFGEPEPWLALLIESLLRAGKGEAAAAATLRQQAFEQAPATAGSIDGKPFQWIADADSRLGPVLEAIVNGRYYWIPFSRLDQVRFEAPTDLRDFVWAIANLRFTNGGEMPALIPVRYPGSEAAGDGLLALSRKTQWGQIGDNAYAGLGQRVLATDIDEHPLLDCREILLSSDSSARAS